MTAQLAQVQEVEFLTAEHVMTQVQTVMFNQLVAHYFEEELVAQAERLVFNAKVEAVLKGLM